MTQPRRAWVLMGGFGAAFAAGAGLVLLGVFTGVFSPEPLGVPSSPKGLAARDLAVPEEARGGQGGHDTPPRARGMMATVVRPGDEAFEEAVALVALVSPKNVSSVHFLVPGKVESCSVKVGDTVAAGAELCRLDTSIAKLERDRARAGVANADRALDTDFLLQQKRLFESGVIGQGDFERVRVETEKAASLRDDARTALALAEKKWDLHTLRAPFGGRVGEVRARAGLPIGPEMPAVLLSSLEGLVLKAEVPARHWDRVGLGSHFFLESVASVKVRSSEREPRFTVTRKAPSVALEKQTFEVELVSDEGAVDGLAPGMLVSGRLVVARYEAGRTLPLEAFAQWESATNEGEVYRRDPLTRRARLVKVRTTPPVKGRVHVVEGLGALDEIVSPVPPHLTEGDIVEGVK